MGPVKSGSNQIGYQYAVNRPGFGLRLVGPNWIDGSMSWFRSNPVGSQVLEAEACSSWPESNDEYIYIDGHICPNLDCQKCPNWAFAEIKPNRVPLKAFEIIYLCNIFGMSWNRWVSIKI